MKKISDKKIKTTKEKIMLEATILFAEQGYAAVSMRAIANRVHIKASSIYNHFRSKENLYEAILKETEFFYHEYYKRLDKKIKKATNFEEILECLFAELKEVYGLFIYYGLSLATTEQFRDEKANTVFSDILTKKGIDYMKKQFDICIKKGWVKPFDTNIAATMIMNSVLVGNLLTTHNDMHQKTILNPQEMFHNIQKFVYATLAK